MRKRAQGRTLCPGSVCQGSAAYFPEKETALQKNHSGGIGLIGFCHSVYSFSCCNGKSSQNRKALTDKVADFMKAPDGRFCLSKQETQEILMLFVCVNKIDLSFSRKSDSS